MFMPFEFFIMAFILNSFGGLFVSAYQYQQTLVDHSRCKVSSFVKVNFIIRYYLLVIPAAVAIGLRWLHFKKIGVSGSQAIYIMLVNKLVQLLVLTLVLISILLSPSFFYEEGLGNMIYIFSVASFAGVLLIFLMIFSDKGRDKIKNIGSGSKSKYIKKIHIKLQNILIVAEKFERKKFIVVVSLGVLSHFLIIVSQYLICLSLNVSLNIIEIAFARSFVALLMLMPISIGGIGVREVGFVGVLTLFGVDSEAGLALALVLLIFQLINGGIGFFFTIYDGQAYKLEL